MTRRTVCLSHADGTLLDTKIQRYPGIAPIAAVLPTRLRDDADTAKERTTRARLLLPTLLGLGTIAAPIQIFSRPQPETATLIYFRARKQHGSHFGSLKSIAHYYVDLNLAKEPEEVG